MKYLFLNKKYHKRGFTLIELLVSLTLLSVVIVTVMGIITLTNAQVRQTRQERRVMDNMSFAIEHMSRSIAYGKSFSCAAGAPPFSCPFSLGGTSVISFQGNYLGLPSIITYERRVNPNTGRGYIARSIGSGSPISITDEALDIEELTFYVYHAEPFAVDREQPRVTVSIKATSYASQKPKSFFIQTTLSQRDLKL